MQHIIYFNQKPLVIGSEKTDLIENILQQPNVLFQDEIDKPSICRMINGMQQETISGGIFLYEDANIALQAFKNEMKVIVAGGGLVHTAENTVLLIFRKNKWDLPKGKLDAGETPEVAALREVHEETGLQSLQLDKPLTITYHTYKENGTFILKESHWFLMKSPQQEGMVPQLEEGIEQCIWVKWSELPSYLENTHPSIIDVIKTGIEKLNINQKI